MKSDTKNCATHVFICNLIKCYQNKGKQRTVSLSSEEPKSRNESNLHATLNNDISGLRSGSNSVTSAATNGSIVERNTHGGRNEIRRSKTFMPAHLSSVSLEVKQKQVIFSNFSLSLSQLPLMVLMNCCILFRPVTSSPYQLVVLLVLLQMECSILGSLFLLFRMLRFHTILSCHILSLVYHMPHLTQRS